MVPRFLNTGFKYAELYGLTDVQQLIDAATALVTTPTEPSSGWTAFTTDGNGYRVSPSTSLQVPQFKFLLVRSTQYRLEMRVRGMNEVQVMSRGLQIPANPCDARIFAGDGLFCIDVATWTTAGEFLWCGSLDTTPDIIDFPGLNTVWGGGSRRTSDYAREYYTWAYNSMQQGDDAPGHWDNVDPMRVTGGSNGAKRHLSGALIYRPRELWAKVRGDTGTYGVTHWVGRTWQTILAPDTMFVPGSKFYCPIDTGVLAQFYSLMGCDAAYGYRPAVRIA